MVGAAFSNSNPAEQLRDLGVPYVPARWSEGETDQATRQAFSRAVRRLTGLGLLVAIRRRGNRISHLRPTPKGLHVAAELVMQRYGTTPDADSLVAALQTAKWATAEHTATTEALREQLT